MLPIVKRLLSLIFIVTLFISCTFQESKTSNGEEASQVESYVRVLPKSELQFPGTNSVCSVTIESSDSWEISGTNDWCSVSSTQGYSGDRVVISVADNMHDDDRSVNLVVSCGDVETTICVVQDPKIETSYVDVGFDNGETISGYNKSTGEVAITYSNDNIPDVAKGNTIVLSDEYMFDIRVIESVSSDGDTFTYSTTQGNIWDVFSDASFTLASNDDILAMDIDGTPVVIPVAKGYLDANGKYVEVYNKYPSSTKTNKRVAQAKSAGYDLVADYRAARYYDEQRGGPSPNAMPNSQYDYECDYPYYDDYYDDYYYDYEEPDDTYMSVTEEDEIYFNNSSNDDILAMDIDGTPVVIPVAKGYLDANGKYVEVYNKYPSSTKTNKRVAQAKSAGYDLVADYRAARYYDEQRGGPSPNAMPYSQYDYEYDYPYYDDYYDDYYYDYEEPDDTYMSVTEEEDEIYFNNSSDNFTTGVEWNFRQDYSGLDIYNGDYGRLWMEKCVFDAGLSCTFEFKFGDSDSDSLFGMMGDLEYFSCMLRGSFGADLLLRYHYYDSMSYSDDKIVKYNVIPTQIYTFVICGVPVHLLIYTHLGQYAEMGLSSGIDASGGVDMGLDMEAGISWSKEDGVKFTKGATPHLTVYPLTLSANTSAYAKVSYYPQIEIGLYGRFGPWFEPRPYIKQEVETGFTLSTGDDYYDSWKSTLYGGLDMRMGLKVDFGFYDKDLWTSKVFSVVDDTPLYTAPKRISLESPSAGDIVVDVNESVNVSFKVDDYCSITDKYSKCSNAFVTFKANGGTLSKTYDATDSSGIANVRWTPFTSSSDTSSKTLTAYIYDGKGNIIDKAMFDVHRQDSKGDTSSEKPNESKVGTHNGHEYVDLGLPSGTKWATCNIGANSPEEHGDYFAWGETRAKSCYDYSNCETKDLRIYDIQGTNYDVAYVKWGGNWCMPTILEFGELINNCTWIWTTQEGQTGYKIIGPNGNSIFLPAVGCRDGDVNKIDDLYGRYWSSSHGHRATKFATFLKFGEKYYETGADSYFYGLPVRPILNDSDGSDFSGGPDYSDEGIHNGHEYVDLGLSVKWATYNVGANRIDEFGDYYNWGGTTPNFIDGVNDVYGVQIDDISGTSHDVAHVNWGGDWRMPTKDEWDELIKNCTIIKACENDTIGFKCTSKKNNNSIFLPAAGYYSDTFCCESMVGYYGEYWTSTPHSEHTEMAYSIHLSDDCYSYCKDYSYRHNGYTIRPVLDY